MTQIKIAIIAILVNLAAALAPVASQLCDDDPLANNGVKITSQSSTSCLKGRSPDMIEIGSCRDNSAHDIQLPFVFNFLGRTYNGSGSVFVSSNSYVTFGGNSTVHSGLGPKTPAFPAFFIGGRDNAMRNLSVGPDALGKGWRVRYEGWSLPSLVTTHQCSLAFPPTIVWELLLSNDGALTLCTDTMVNVAGISAISDGSSDLFIQKFILTPSTFYTISTGLPLCRCDKNPLINKGVQVTSHSSSSCMKGPTPDRIVLRSCSTWNSTSVLLPFPFNFLNRTYGGINNDIFVGDASYITFGGSSIFENKDINSFDKFEPTRCPLPSIFIGSGKNTLLELSVAPDPTGWRIRYEGFTRPTLQLSEQGHIAANTYLSSLCAKVSPNIAWELLFLRNGTLQLCTSSFNIDPSAISALSDGISNSFFQNFTLAPSTLFTISTGLRQCPKSCDINPAVNKGVKITSKVSTSCLKGKSVDMIDLGSCQDDTAFDIRLPFPFRYLDRTYRGDVQVNSNSIVNFGSNFGKYCVASGCPLSHNALVIGSLDWAMRTLSVGPDALGWRVRFEGWSDWRIKNCSTPVDIIWELLFLYDSTLQLCTSSFSSNLDLSQDPNSKSGVYHGDSRTMLTIFYLEPSALYTVSTGLPPCSLDISLSSPIASLNGSSLTARFPPDLDISRYDSITLVITLQGAGFSCAPDSSVSLVVLPVSSRAYGRASITNSKTAVPLLIVSLHGMIGCSLVSFELQRVTTPLLPQSFRPDINFAVYETSTNTSIFKSNSGSLIEITPPLIIEEGQPFLQLTNSVSRSTTTITISLTPRRMKIPASFSPSILVITLVGADWSLASNAQVQFVSPQEAKFASANITAHGSSAVVLRVTFSGAVSISDISFLQLLMFDMKIVGVAQSAIVNIHSAILNAAESIIASGRNGRLDAVVDSTMGDRSPAVTISPPVASASAVRIAISLTPMPQNQLIIELPAHIIITLTGSGILCATNSSVHFMSPFDAIGGANFHGSNGKSLVTITISSGTFLSGYPVSFQFGRCSAPTHVQPMTNVSAAMMDCKGRTVAASSSGTLSAIVQDMGHSPILRLADHVLDVTFTPGVSVPANSVLIISLTGVGLVCEKDTAIKFTQSASGAAGSASIEGRPLENVLTVTFNTQLSASSPISFTVSPVYGGCTAVGNLTAALVDNGGNILAATASSLFSAVVVHPLVTVQQRIGAAVNGVVVIPEGVYAGSCNCNNVIDKTVPALSGVSLIEMKGFANRSIIDCTGTGMRCLIVMDLSVKITNITFKGGVSPSFISSDMIKAIQEVFEAENPYYNQHQHYIRISVPSSQRRVHQSKWSFHKHIFLRHMAAPTRANTSDIGFDIKRPVFFQALTGSKKKYTPSRRTSSRTRRILSNQGSRVVFGKIKMPRRSKRQLLQSADGVKQMFHVNEQEAGGCILVLAPKNSVFLHGVSILNCSALYGGGGFFNVSFFEAANGVVASNVARQGGGIFVSALQGAKVEMFEFFNNTVVTHLISPWGSSPIYSYFGMFSVVPDAAAAAGGGAWFTLLTYMRNCSFRDNLAMAASPSVTKTTSTGAHALGSGMFVLRTSSGSILSNLMFLRSTSLCTGVFCVSAGSLFIAITGIETSISVIFFIECQVRATGVLWTAATPQAVGACVTVLDASAGRLRIENLSSSNCTIESAMNITGGCISFLSNVNGAVISQISVSNFKGVSSNSSNSGTCGHGGILAFETVENTQISGLVVKMFQFSCKGAHVGAMMFAFMLKNTTLSSLSITNVTYNSEIGALVGGMVSIFSIDSNSFLGNISIENALFQTKAGFKGACIYVRGGLAGSVNHSGNVILSTLFLKNVSAFCASNNCQASSLLYLVCSNVYIQTSSIVLKDLNFQDISILCTGMKCSSYASILIETESTVSPFISLSNSASFMLLNASFQNIFVRCAGKACFVGGGCLFVSVRDGIIDNIQLRNVTASANGNGSFAGGSFMFHSHNNPTKAFLVRNIHSEVTSISSSGMSSFAMGGVIAAIYGNVTIERGRFLYAVVSCSGENCQSLGGALAFVSSLGTNVKRTGIFSAALSRNEVRHSIVECLGAKCVASGGAIYTGVAYRGPYDFGSDLFVKFLAFKGLKPQALRVIIDDCEIVGNTVKSASINSSLSGAGIAFFFATGVLLQSNVIENVIHSSYLSAFVGGAGVYVSGSSANVSIFSAQIKLNIAGGDSMGGAVFVGQSAVLMCRNVAIILNKAAKGGGLLVDDAAASLFSCAIFNNSASDKGGGLFCVASTSLKTTGTQFVLSNVTVRDNYLTNSNPGAVGAAVYIFGDVLLELLDGTRFEMNGNSQFTTTEAVVATSKQTTVHNDTATLCKSGSVLTVAPTQVTSQKISFYDSVEREFETQCSPACLPTPEITKYMASSGFLASCIPCPRGTYSMVTSSNANETVFSQCRQCPFGAVCNGGSNISAATSHWGWKVSDNKLSERFMLLPSGFACEQNCTSISPCGGHRDGVLCGACLPNYSVAFFTTACVPSAQCAYWKWGLLIFLCVSYQFCFSLWMFWSSETHILLSRRSLVQQVLGSVLLFDNLSPIQIEDIASKMELEDFLAHKTVIEQGQPSNFIYFVKKGVLNVHILDDTGNERLESKLVSPEMFGEVSSSKIAKSSVRSLVDCELWKLDRSCLDFVSDADKISYIRSKQLSVSDEPANDEKKSDEPADDEVFDDAFGVLMWFYQIAGIMLSVSSPLSYLRGTAVFYGVISFLANSKPASQVASDVAETAGSSLPDKDDSQSTEFQFCVDPSFTTSQLYVTSFMYYVCWAILMAVFAHERFWKVLRSMICAMSLRMAKLLDILSVLSELRCKCGAVVSNDSSLREVYDKRQTENIEIRGPIVLKWFITCFNAIAILMMQGTSCFQLNGFSDAAGSRRWIYDGRVVCFSNAGEFSGQWQVASALGVAIVFLAPAVLWRIMIQIERKVSKDQSAFEKNLLEAYSGTHASNACHWKVVMFYQRLLMMAVSNYLDFTPFYQGYILLFLSIIILLLECIYRPYKSVYMQVLSCTSAVVLVAICGLLLRSHALVSGARSPNFEASDPDIESSTVSSELLPIIVLIIILLTVPAITAIILTIRSNLKFKKLKELKAQSKTTQRHMSHASLSEEDNSSSSEQLRGLQSIALPRELAIQLSLDSPSSVDPSSFQYVPSAAHSASSVLDRPLNSILSHSSIPEAQRDSYTQGECLELETDFHFCDFETNGTSGATRKYW